ncbi:MAG: type II toxin-antitoxin system death-on-curing family toxin [Nitrospinota bacterium]
MTPEPEWLTAEEVLALHEQALVEFGGLAGVRDRGLLESAVQRPRQLYHYGESPTLLGLAAALCVGLVKNHPFVGGDKRAAFVSAAAFLDLNGWDFVPTPGTPTTLIRAAAAGEADEALLARWFREFSKRRRPQGRFANRPYR